MTLGSNTDNLYMEHMKILYDNANNHKGKNELSTDAVGARVDLSR